MKKKLDFGWLPYVLVLLIIIVVIVFVIVFEMVSYMSLNNWDMRCIFVECKPVRVIGGEE